MTTTSYEVEKTTEIGNVTHKEYLLSPHLMTLKVVGVGDDTYKE